MGFDVVAVFYVGIVMVMLMFRILTFVLRIPERIIRHHVKHRQMTPAQGEAFLITHNDGYLTKPPQAHHQPPTACVRPLSPPKPPPPPPPTWYGWRDGYKQPNRK